MIEEENKPIAKTEVKLIEYKNGTIAKLKNRRVQVVQNKTGDTYGINFKSFCPDGDAGDARCVHETNGDFISIIGFILSEEAAYALMVAIDNELRRNEGVVYVKKEDA